MNKTMNSILLKKESFEGMTGRHLGFHARKLAFSVFRLIILLSIGYIVIYPILYMVIASLREPRSFLDPTRIWIPEKLTLDNYATVFKAMDYGKTLLTTVRIEVVSAIFQVAACALPAYGFARFKFKLRKILLPILFITILVPPPVIILPLSRNFANLDFLGILGLFNTLTSVDLRLDIYGTTLSYYLPSLLGVGLRSGILIFIYMQFFKNLPAELEEAARIDGAGSLRTFLSIAVPSSGVVIITVTMFSLLWHWNDYYNAVMFLTGDVPMAVTITTIGETMKSMGLLTWGFYHQFVCMMAACVLFVTPMLVVYLVLQRWFIESIDRVGITG